MDDKGTIADTFGGRQLDRCFYRWRRDEFIEHHFYFLWFEMTKIDINWYICSYKVRKTIENLEWENYNRI